MIEEEEITQIKNQDEYWREMNKEMKNKIAALKLKESPLKKNVFVQFSPSGEIFSGLNTTKEQKFEITPINPNDHYFIQNFSYILQDKAQCILECHMENHENTIGETLAKSYCLKIRENFEKVYENLIQKNSPERNEPLIAETRAYLVLWIFFEYFMVFKNDTVHLMSIRELFYKYVYRTEIEDLLNQKEMKNIIEDQLKRVDLLMRICDFSELSNVFATLAVELNENSAIQMRFPGVYREFAHLFDYLSQFSKNYQDIFLSSNLEAELPIINKNVENFNLKCREIINTIYESTNKANQLNEMVIVDIRWLLSEIDTILTIFTGDLDEIQHKSANVKEYILMSVFYRFYKKDWLNSLQETLRPEEIENPLEELLITTLTYEPLEFYQNLKGNVPKWLQFHFMDLLYDLDALTNYPQKDLDEMTLIDYDYTDFLNYLVLLDVDFENFNNYVMTYRDIESNYLQYFDIFALRNVDKVLKVYEQSKEKRDQLCFFIDYKILDVLIERIKGCNFIANSVIKICFNKFLEMGEYNLALHFYLRFPKAGFYQNLFEKLFYIILLNDDIPDKFQNLLQIDIPSQKEDNSVAFLIRLINFYNVFINNSREDFSSEALLKIRQFFDFCFVEERCPKIMWLWVLRLLNKLYQNYYEGFKAISYEEYLTAFGNTHRIEYKIKSEMKRFTQIHGSQLFQRGCKIYFNLVYLLRDAKNPAEIDALIKEEFFQCADFLLNCYNRSFAS